LEVKSTRFAPHHVSVMFLEYELIILLTYQMGKYIIKKKKIKSK